MAATHFSGPLYVGGLASTNGAAVVSTTATTLAAADNGKTYFSATARVIVP